MFNLPLEGVLPARHLCRQIALTMPDVPVLPAQHPVIFKKQEARHWFWEPTTFTTRTNDQLFYRDTDK